MDGWALQVRRMTGERHVFLRMLLLLFVFLFLILIFSLSRAHGEERWMALAALETRGWRQSGT